MHHDLPTRVAEGASVFVAVIAVASASIPNGDASDAAADKATGAGGLFVRGLPVRLAREGSSLPGLVAHNCILLVQVNAPAKAECSVFVLGVVSVMTRRDPVARCGKSRRVGVSGASGR